MLRFLALIWYTALYRSYSGSKDRLTLKIKRRIFSLNFFMKLVAIIFLTSKELAELLIICFVSCICALKNSCTLFGSLV